MKHFTQITFFFIFLLVYFNATAQKQGKVSKCATMERLELLFERNPQLRIRFEQQRDQFNKAVEPDSYRVSRLTETVYYIPVIFHIVTTNPASITDAQIQAQLDTLNKDYAGANGDSVIIPPYFKSLFGKSSVRFCLAKRDPNDEPATGIERITTTKTSFTYVNDGVKYSSSGGANSWNTEKYLNIWICALSDNLLGYATFPDDGLPQAQGVVIDYRSLPGASYANYNGGKTLSHEVGHYFNLYHIWGDDNGACSGTDYVEDTPNQADATSGCYSGVKTDNCTPSGNGILYQNYMDYSYDHCLVMFTAKQVTRVETALLAYRSSLLNSNGCIPVVVHTFDAELVSINNPEARICTASFTPAITIKNLGTQTLTSVTIHYSIDQNNIKDYLWTGSLNQYASGNVDLPSMTAEEGSHKFYVYLTNPNGNPDQDTSNDTLNKKFSYYTSVETVAEGFENNSFPPGKWDVVNPDRGLTWQRVTNVSKMGSACVKINNFDYNAIGQQDYLRLPALNITGKDSAFLSFYIAAATYTSSTTPEKNSWDTLEVLVSKDCGKTYTTLYKKYGSNLVTRTQPATTAFVPTAAEWRKDSVDLGNYIDAGNMLIAFRNTTGYENNIYLDDINLRTVKVNSNLKEQGFMVTPNPTTGAIQVQFYPLPDKLSGIEIFSADGLKIIETKVATGQANNLYSYDLSRYSPGIYFVKATFTDRIAVRKIIKN